jgi:hypothetical protein
VYYVYLQWHLTIVYAYYVVILKSLDKRVIYPGNNKRRAMHAAYRVVAFLTPCLDSCERRGLGFLPMVE